MRTFLGVLDLQTLLFWVLLILTGLGFYKTFLPLAEKLLSKTPWKADEYLLRHYRFSLTFAVLYLFLKLLQSPFSVKVPLKVETSLFLLLVFAFLFQTADLIHRLLVRSEKLKDYLHLFNFLFRLLKFFILVLGLLTVLQNVGYNVETLLASLGIGGLAVALAAKDTISNIFGGLTLVLDNPLSRGDWVLIDGKYEGTVEEVGLRSLKIRTFEKSVLTLPNSKVANSSIENFSRRKVRRIKFDIKISFETSPEKVEKFIDLLREYLKSNPNISKEQVILVYLKGLEDYAYTVMIYCFANTSEWERWLSIRQEVLLKVSKLLKELKINLAFPILRVNFENGKYPIRDEDFRIL